MMRFALVGALAGLLLALPARAEGVRYFGVWSFMDNTVAEEIPAEARAERKLGYWALEFDAAGQVLGGSYHGSDGAEWLRVRYVTLDGRVYADLFAPDGTHRSRKSTYLKSQIPAGLDQR